MTSQHEDNVTRAHAEAGQQRTAAEEEQDLMRNHTRQSTQERETPVERGQRSRAQAGQARDEVGAEACKRVDVARLLSGPSRDSDREKPTATISRSRGESPQLDGRDEVRGKDAGLARLQAEAATMKREEPLKFSAVERELSRLRGVVKLEDPRQLKIEIQRHAVLLGEEKDPATAARLYTRTLALAELHTERTAELDDLNRARPVIERSRTEPFPVQQAMKARPLPVLLDCDLNARSEQSLSPLEGHVQRLELAASPLVRVVDELDTDPITNRDRTSDVFLPVSGKALSQVVSVKGQSVRELTSGAELRARPLESAPRADRAPIPGAGERADPRRAQPDENTIEMAANHRGARLSEGRLTDERRLRDNAREQELLRVASVSERAFVDVKHREPERAIRVMALVSTFQFAPELQTRDQVLEAHGRAWQRRAGECDESLWRTQEENVMALGVLARQRADEHSVLATVARKELVDSARELMGPERDALRSSLKGLFARPASLDAEFCGREMMRAADVDDIAAARVFALALESDPQRAFLASGRAARELPKKDADEMPTAKVGVIDEGRTQVSSQDIERLQSELVDLRIAYALKEITAHGATRAQRVVAVLSSVNDRTQEAPSLSPSSSRELRSLVG